MASLSDGVASAVIDIGFLRAADLFKHCFYREGIARRCIDALGLAHGPSACAKMRSRGRLEIRVPPGHWLHSLSFPE